MSTDWQSHKERSTPLAIKSIIWIALHLGRFFARLVLYPITGYFLVFAPKQRRASLNYLKRVLNHKPTWLDVARHIHCFSSTILDRVFLISGRFEELSVTFPAENLPRQYLHQGVSCLLLGSHVGSFEVLRSYAVQKTPLPLKILMYERQTPMITQIFHALNPDVASTLIPLDGNPASLLKVKEALDNGSVVGLLGDRVMAAGKEKTVRCRLLGEEVELPSAPVLIAATLKAPLIVFFGIYQGGNRYQIYFELLAEEITLSRSNRQQDIQIWMQKYADILEKYIRLAPYNWFNFYDYWQDEQH